MVAEPLRRQGTKRLRDLRVKKVTLNVAWNVFL